MTTTRLPGTDLDLFPLVLGGNVFGWSADEASSYAVLDAFAAAGGTMVDTADAYARWLGNGGGESETILGAWMAARGNRDEVLVATKMGKLPPYDNLQPDSIRAACDDSLRRLGTDRIDLYYAHQDHLGDDLAAALEAFDGLVRAGKVRHLAASNFTAARLAEALDLQAAHGWSPFVALQPEYNLVERAEYETEYAALCTGRGIGTLPYYGLARGFLTGKYRGGADIASVRGESVIRYADERGERVLTALESIAAGHGVPMAAVALAWLRTRPAVAAPIASARTVEQLADLLPMASLALTPDEFEALDTSST
ncbi:MAG TPA: aldo/keto reductase [Candidatus Nanopelagicales bacterium]|nr:aldo/keto reductase [Candidatus Nanopelagicales bacterium]